MAIEIALDAETAHSIKLQMICKLRLAQKPFQGAFPHFSYLKEIGLRNHQVDHSLRLFIGQF